VILISHAAFSVTIGRYVDDQLPFSFVAQAITECCQVLRTVFQHIELWIRMRISVQIAPSRYPSKGSTLY